MTVLNLLFVMEFIIVAIRRVAYTYEACHGYLIVEHFLLCVTIRVSDKYSFNVVVFENIYFSFNLDVRFYN